MSKRLFAAIALLLLSVGPTSAQNVCPCVPISHTWVVTACETWNCAQSTMILADGDPYVLSVPTGGSQFKWIIVRRIVTGTATVSPDAPFIIDSFTSASDAVSRFGVIAPEMLPIMVTTVDGDSLLIRLRAPDPQGRRRVVTH